MSGVQLIAPLGRGRVNLFVRGPRFQEDLLAAELRTLGATDVTEAAGGVQVRGDLGLAYSICWGSRLASRVLWPLASFEARDADDLYAGVAALDWPGLMAEGATLAVGFDGRSDALRHSGFAARRVKDAVVDVMRHATGSRPDVDTEAPDVRLQAVLHRGRLTLYLDLAGVALHRRGYRQAGGAAPLKENLAAALLLRAGWDDPERQRGWLVDPTCGSGTLLIEGALMAAGVAPGRQREHWGFTGWRGHDPERLQRVVDAAEAATAAQTPRSEPIRLMGLDADYEQLARVEVNLQGAGIGTDIPAEVRLEARPLAKLPRLPEPAGLVVSNPPYGQRLDRGSALADLGAALRRAAPGWPVGILVARPDAERRALDEATAGEQRTRRDGARDLLVTLGLPKLVRHDCRNGPLDAWMLTGAVEVLGGADDDAADDASGAGSAEVEAAALEHAQMFANRVRKNVKKLGKWAQRHDLQAWRLYDRDLPEYGFVVDRYGHALCVQEVAPPAKVDPVMAERRRRAALAVLPEAAGVDPEDVVLKLRRRQTPQTQYERQADTDRTQLVREGAARFEVNLHDFLDTGLYLDSRGVRRLVADYFAGRSGGSFLNLCAYTATATVQAALAGATTSLSVDLSNTYLAWAERNLRLNALDPAAHRLERGELRGWLQGDDRQRKEKHEVEGENSTEERFDLILLDPPTFSNSTRAEDDLDLQRDHGGLLDAALTQLSEATDAQLLFVCHARRFKLDWAPPPGWAIDEITKATLDEDCSRGRPAHRTWRIARSPSPPAA